MGRDGHSGVVRPLRSPNPLHEEWQAAATEDRLSACRDVLVSEYSFAVPTPGALAAVAAASAMGVVEIGAGTGYWARLLHERGVDVLAFDVAPAPSHENPWFSLVAPWFDVVAADHTVVDAHGERTLLLVWPTKNESWASECLERFAAAGGRHVIYVGEGPGGRTGDDKFHALLGGYDRCYHCSLDIRSVPCLCGVQPIFALARTVQIPRWPGYSDSLGVYVAEHTRDPITPHPPANTTRQRRRRATSR